MKTIPQKSSFDKGEELKKPSFFDSNQTTIKRDSQKDQINDTSNIVQNKPINDIRIIKNYFRELPGNSKREKRYFDIDYLMIFRNVTIFLI